MALARKNLYFGQLATSKADIYSPSSADGLVHNILIHNTHSAAETVSLFYHDGSNEYQLYEMSVNADETVHLEYIGEGFYVEDAGKITGNTSTTASAVTIKIDGTEETA